MDTFSTRTPWYVAGLAFECIQCGQCCAGPAEGYVWLTGQEAGHIAEFLGIGVEEMYRRFLRKVGRRHTIIEDSATRDCIFLRPDQSRPPCRGCSIYAVRPRQCRTWPFWPANLSSPEAWIAAAVRCPGINRGRRYTYDEIEQRRAASGT